MTYDDAGNVLIDQKFRNLKFQYDANNRQKQSSNLDDTGVVVSVYDAGGQRVATQAGGTLTNVLVYDATGKLVAEYDSAPPASNGTQFVTADHQGSQRAITSSDGSVVSRHDYLPFGEDIPGNVGMRSTAQGYAQSDGVRQKHAGMENDDATDMSHTLWRQYDDLSARWTAPDPYGGSMTVANPQSFNRYNYVENDPVNKVDPLGLMTMVDASMSYGDVSGMWAGGGLNFGGPETGRSIIAGASARHDQGIRDLQKAAAINTALQSGKMTPFQALLEVIAAGGALAIEQTESVTVSVTELSDTAQEQYSSNSTMIVIWEPGYNPFGHVSYITMQDDTSYSWEGVGTIDTPSAKYTDARSAGTMGSTGEGYILDFGSLNAKFQKTLRHAYDGPFGIAPPYGPISNNCAKAGIVAINSIRRDLEARDNIKLPKLSDIRPSAVKAYIEKNLSRYVVAQQKFPYH